MCVLTVEGRVMNAQWFGKTIGIKLRTVLPQRAIVCSHSPTEVTCHPRTSVFNDEHVNFPDPDCLVRVHQMEVVSNLVQQVRTMDLGPNLNRTSRTTPGPRARRRAPRLTVTPGLARWAWPLPTFCLHGFVPWWPNRLRSTKLGIGPSMHVLD